MPAPYHPAMETQNHAVPGPATGPAAAIRFCSVAKRYRGRDVLRDVSFTVPAGSSVAIAGVNGAGKSTLLRCLLDFTEPDGGWIRIGERDHHGLDARSQVAWLPERFVPPAHLSAGECLHWLAGLRGARVDESLMRSLADDLGLGAGALQKRVRELSKGMTQKLGLMSIGLSDCPIWILDEPMSGLDPLARRNVARLLDAARHAGRTVLFTSHGLRDLPALCEQLVVLHDGSVRFCGTPREFGERHGSEDLEEAFLSCIGEVPRTMPVAPLRIAPAPRELVA